MDHLVVDVERLDDGDPVALRARIRQPGRVVPQGPGVEGLAAGGRIESGAIEDDGGFKEAA